jgi:flavodoxin
MPAQTLVVCYSRSGSTLRIATQLAELLAADLEQIAEYGSRQGTAGYVRSALEAAAKGLPTIDARRDPRDYASVVVGTPVWVGTMCSPVRSYLFQYGRELRNPAFFAVMGGRGAEATVREMSLLCRAPQAPTCTFTQGDVDKERFVHQCRDFAGELRRDSRFSAAFHSAA